MDNLALPEKCIQETKGMNKKEIRTIDQEAQRFMKDTKLTPTEEDDCVRLDLTFSDPKSQALYLFVSKRKKDKRFTLMIPVQSTGIIAATETLALLQPLLKTYGLILTQQAVITEESINLPLHKRIRNMSQALVAIDGIRRLWNVAKEAVQEGNIATKSQDIKSISHAAISSSSR